MHVEKTAISKTQKWVCVLVVFKEQERRQGSKKSEESKKRDEGIKLKKK